MRELFVVAEESTEALWVLRTHEGERFCIPRADLARRGEQGFESGFDEGTDDYEVVEAELIEEPPARPTLTVLHSADERDLDNEPAKAAHTSENGDEFREHIGDAAATHTANRTHGAVSSAPRPEPSAIVSTAVDLDAQRQQHQQDQQRHDHHARPERQARQEHRQREQRHAERSPGEPDPLFANPLTMPPKDIQARIRSGTSAGDLAREMGVAESRIEPYAHPVLLEREQVANVAKQSHPVRADGPAQDTLFEILALTFASRGHALSEATWDAVREAGEPWIVRLTWQAGLQQHQAEWFFRRSMTSGATTEPRDAVAADLIDPSFAQPVRSLSAVSTGYDVGGHPADYGTYADQAHGQPYPDQYGGNEQQPGHEPYQRHDGRDLTQHPDEGYAERSHDPRQQYPQHGQHPPQQPDLFAEGETLQTPHAQDKPQKRRRKAVTPHWEDVLLGVRTNTKRPK